MKDDGLVECVDCGMLVDSDDEFCPYCDAPIFSSGRQERNRKRGGIGSVLVAAAVVIVFIFFLK